MDFLSWYSAREQAFFYAQNISSSNIRDFTYLQSRIIALKNVSIFLFTPQGIPYTPLDQFYNFKRLVLKSCMSKGICYFSFLNFNVRQSRWQNQKKNFFRDWQRKRNTCLRPKNYQFIISHEIYFIHIVI